MANIRQQLKADTAHRQEIAADAIHWTQEHRNAIIFTLVGAIVVALAILGVYAYLQKQNNQAAAALGHAMHVLNSPVRQAGQPVDPNELSFGSAQERDKAALGEFEAIAGKYPRTDAGRYSLYLAGVVQLDSNDAAGAEKSFQRAKDEGNDQVSSLGKLALANLYVSEKRDQDAIKLYNDLIDHPTTAVPKATSELQLAQFYEAKKQNADAVKIYDQMQKDNAKNPIGDLAEKKIAQLKASVK
ncbi:MAG TPA: tetratricopeptide repeat protein [Terriglobales bacterium]